MAESSANAEAIQAWLLSKLSERLGIESHEIDIREPFASYGLGSTEAVSLAGELAEWLGRKLSPALVYEYPTIEALARHLAGSPDVPESATRAGQDREAKNEPIAIIGIGCRFPGANDTAAFWQLLRDGVDAIREVPADRFDQHAFYDPDPAAPGKMNTRWGGFLGQVDQFDPNFFGISPREALRMDPQQRLLLEVTWEALQDAGQVPEHLVGTQAGVFIGIATNDYGRLQWNDLKGIDAYAGTGNALSIAANRISYLFDFRGPSLAIDTACSSSLVAVHLACCSLRSGESTLALAGGVNLILSPAIAINFTKAGAMAPDGRCKAFDARANGYVRSEGAGVVVLKPLSKALADGDPIYAVIRGSAVNQDGRSNGLMAPNPLAQEAVLREAYRQAAVSPGKVQYVEAHGTGTLLGDPIEAKALGTVLGVERSPGTALRPGVGQDQLGPP
jgi:acyl transferase domain-containing protein/acyl carrier protein